MSTESIRSFLVSTGGRFGLDAELSVILVPLTLFAIFVVLLLLFRGRERSVPVALGFERMGAVLGRIEKLELTLNEFKSNTAKSIELFRGDAGYVKQELSELRALLERSGGDGGTSRGGGGTTSTNESSEMLGRAVQATVPSETTATSAQALTTPRIEREIVAPAAEISAVIPLAERLTKSRRGLWERLASIFGGGATIDPAAIESLEALLVQSDLGPKVAEHIVSAVRLRAKSERVIDEAGVQALLRDELMQAFASSGVTHGPVRFVGDVKKPAVVMVVGVNGVGKTTTVAKLAKRWKDSGSRVLIVAADTFRAAAVDQLEEWGKRINVPVVSGALEAKPATVVFEGMARALELGVDIVIIDTAGRLHTKSNLMQELSGLRNMVVRHIPEGPQQTLLVLDGVTGQNALSQAREFHEAATLTGIVVTKLDGTPKGGVVVALADEFKLPICYIGVGEGPEDLRDFDVTEFVEALCRPEGTPGTTAPRYKRRRPGEDLSGLAIYSE